MDADDGRYQLNTDHHGQQDRGRQSTLKQRRDMDNNRIRLPGHGADDDGDGDKGKIVSEILHALGSLLQHRPECVRPAEELQHAQQRHHHQNGAQRRKWREGSDQNDRPGGNAQARRDRPETGKSGADGRQTERPRKHGKPDCDA